MALVTSSQPSLIGGVSQQPEVLRPRGSAEAQENAFSSVVDGLIKRHPSNHLSEHAWTTSFVHPINRDETEKYFLCIDDSGVPRVLDTDGVEYTIFENAGHDISAYLDVGSLPARERYRAVTIADTTVIINREVTVTASSATGDSPLLEHWRAFVSFRIGAFSTRYRVTFRSAAMAAPYEFSIKTWEGTNGTNVWTGSGQTWALNGGGTGATGFWNTAPNQLASQMAAGINLRYHAINMPVVATAKDGVLMLWADGNTVSDDDFDPDDSSVEFEISDAFAGQGMVACWTEVERLSDLPRTFLHNYRMNIQGDESDNQDDFTVRFEGNDPTNTTELQQGRWSEYYEYGSVDRIALKYTMPVRLVRRFNTSGGNPTGEANKAYFDVVNDDLAWEQKQVGNDETNPVPSFVGETINEVFFYENRLGFLSGQNVIMSGANGFFDFWQESTQAGLLDSDVIDVAAGHTSVAILRNAIAVGNALIVMSDQVQFQVLSGEDGILSPKTISLSPISTNSTEPFVKPTPLGGTLMFPFQRGLFSGITEMVPAQGSQGAWSFNTITDQVPQYIAGAVTSIAADSRLGVIVVLANNDPSNLYIFKEFQGPEGRLQSAWFRYSFSGSPTITAAEFVNGTLYIFFTRGSVTTLETMEFHASPVDPGSDMLMRVDRKILETALTSRIYTAATDSTALTLPYTLAGAEVPVVVSRDNGTNVAGNQAKVLSNTSTVVTVEGDWSTTPLWVGTQYEMLYQFAKPQLRATEGRGTSSLQNGRVQVIKGTLVHDGTGYFKVGVTLPTRTEVVKTFGPVISGPGSLVGSLLYGQAVQDGRFNFHVMGNADDAVITVRNDSPLPSNFQKAEWEIQYNSKATRFRG